MAPSPPKAAIQRWTIRCPEGVGLSPSALRTHRRKPVIGFSLPENGRSPTRNPDPERACACQIANGPSQSATDISQVIIPGWPSVIAVIFSSMAIRRNAARGEIDGLRYDQAIQARFMKKRLKVAVIQ